MPLSDVLTDEEVAQRVAILKRFRELLIEQRDRFKTYLAALDSQKDKITGGDIEDLSVQADFEEKILADIISLEKSIVPMRELYESAFKDEAAPDISELDSVLENLKTEAARRSRENTEILQKKLVAIRGEIKNLRANPFQRSRRAVRNEAAQANFLDIQG
ncbi:MAG: flagellar biosynthesis protein FlgN [Spirochaetaceae bacterium]|jgi:hypothetical protein|nr:flagellar biosynthesis protein FlgN [Spirochaetaceae bacterium]GMO27708.1 MAG: hypothetical protein Pg6A_15380 [Termitinemataceae bacterium]